MILQDDDVNPLYHHLCDAVLHGSVCLRSKLSDQAPPPMMTLAVQREFSSVLVNHPAQ